MLATCAFVKECSVFSVPKVTGGPPGLKPPSVRPCGEHHAHEHFSNSRPNEGPCLHRKLAPRGFFDHSSSTVFSRAADSLDGAGHASMHIDSVSGGTGTILNRSRNDPAGRDVDECHVSNGAGKGTPYNPA